MSDVSLSEDEVYVFNLIHKYLMNLPFMMLEEKRYLLALSGKECFVTGLSLKERKVMFGFKNPDLPEISICVEHLRGSQILKQIEEIINDIDRNSTEQNPYMRYLMCKSV